MTLRVIAALSATLLLGACAARPCACHAPPVAAAPAAPAPGGAEYPGLAKYLTDGAVILHLYVDGRALLWRDLLHGDEHLVGRWSREGSAWRIAFFTRAEVSDRDAVYGPVDSDGAVQVTYPVELAQWSTTPEDLPPDMVLEPDADGQLRSAPASKGVLGARRFKELRGRDAERWAREAWSVWLRAPSRPARSAGPP